MMGYDVGFAAVYSQNPVQSVINDLMYTVHGHAKIDLLTLFILQTIAILAQQILHPQLGSWWTKGI